MRMENINDRRKELGLSVQQVADALHISKQHFFNICNRGEVDVGLVEPLCKLLKFTLPEDFYWYTGYTLEINRRFQKLKQEQVAELFGFTTPRLRKIAMSDNLYDYKEKFHEVFKPMIFPAIKVFDEIKVLEIK